MRRPPRRGQRDVARTLKIAIRGGVSPARARTLIARARTAMEDAPPRAIVCDMRGATASLALLDALAQLALSCRRAGVPLRLRGASAEVVQLIELAGLGEALGG